MVVEDDEPLEPLCLLDPSETELCCSPGANSKQKATVADQRGLLLPSTMADIERKGSDAVDNTIETKKGHELNEAEKQNAVGYDEYLEALDLEVSDKEVGDEVRPTLDQTADPGF